MVGWIANEYIMRNMGHEYMEQREELFATISDAYTKEFYEDNIHTRVYQTVEWMLMQDSVFVRIYDKLCNLRRKDDAKEFVKMLAKNAHDGILEARDNLFGTQDYEKDTSSR